MKLYYEFIMEQQEQLITLSYRASYLRRYHEQRSSAWGRVINWCGDALIDCGSWMKRVSSSPIDKNSVGIYSRN